MSKDFFLLEIREKFMVECGNVFFFHKRRIIRLILWVFKFSIHLLISRWIVVIAWGYKRDFDSPSLIQCVRLKKNFSLCIQRQWNIETTETASLVRFALSVDSNSTTKKLCKRTGHCFQWTTNQHRNHWSHYWNNWANSFNSRVA